MSSHVFIASLPGINRALSTVAIYMRLHCRFGGFVGRFGQPWWLCKLIGLLLSAILREPILRSFGNLLFAAVVI